ncbi:MAG: hypothetical protein VXZ55_01115, partial [Planctomycetota bacterium]|nr:hypothetical protein [Planctomycetota bacterium]
SRRSDWHPMRPKLITSRQTRLNILILDFLVRLLQLNQMWMSHSGIHRLEETSANIGHPNSNEKPI